MSDPASRVRVSALPPGRSTSLRTTRVRTRRAEPCHENPGGDHEDGPQRQLTAVCRRLLAWSEDLRVRGCHRSAASAARRCAPEMGRRGDSMDASEGQSPCSR